MYLIGVIILLEAISMNESYRLVITAKEVRGKCSVFEVGDRIVVEKPKISEKKVL